MKKFIITTTALLTFSLPAITPAHAGDNVMYNMAVKGMMCASCAARTKNVLKKMDGVKSVKIDMKIGGTSTVAVCATPATKFTDVQLKELFLSKGFSYKGNSKAGTC